MLKKLYSFLSASNSKKNDSTLISFINLKFKLTVKNPTLFEEALTHKSMASANDNNYERLEFLGDSILGGIISHILYEKFVDCEEGDLTRFKAKIVSRKSLNAIGEKLGLDEVIIIEKSINIENTSILGNAFEAIIGAIYLDQGYTETYKVISGILDETVDFKMIDKIDLNYKGILIEHCHKKAVSLKFHTTHQRDENGDYSADILINQEPYSQGSGRSKKIAEQSASKAACEKLQLIP